MERQIEVEVRWDDEAGVWTATSSDVTGLVIEAATWADMITETKLVMPDLLELNGEQELLKEPLHFRFGPPFV